MNPMENFNGICSEAISFKHDKVVDKQIFEIVNLLGCAKLFKLTPCNYQADPLFLRY